MPNYTEHYQLHQWEPEDHFLRTDFNEDFAKIDTALGDKAEKSAVESLDAQVQGKIGLISGSYTGNGGTQTIHLGFRPQAVYLCYSYYVLSYGCSGINLTSNGFMVSGSGTINANKEGTVYTYFAFY